MRMNDRLSSRKNDSLSFKLSEVYVILHEDKLVIKNSEREPQLPFFPCGLRTTICYAEWPQFDIRQAIGGNIVTQCHNLACDLTRTILPGANTPKGVERLWGIYPIHLGEWGGNF